MKYSKIYYENNKKGEKLEKEEKIDEAIEVFESNLQLFLLFYVLLLKVI